MLGSNNEVAVLDAVLASLSKSPAFALLEAAHTETTANSEPAVFHLVDEYLELVGKIKPFQIQLK